MGWGKLVRVGIIGCCLLSSLTACGPRGSKALVGMSVDDAGNPVMVLKDCEGVIQEIEFYDSSIRPTSATEPSSPQVEYKNSHPKKTVSTIPLTGGSEWKPSGPVPTLRATGEYSIQIWGKNHGWRGRGNQFTPADLKGLKPGLVWYHAPTDTPSAGGSPVERTFSKNGHHWNVVTPLEDFAPGGCP